MESYSIVNLVKASRSYVCMKIAILFFLSIYSLHLGSLATQHTTVCLNPATYDCVGDHSKC